MIKNLVQEGLTPGPSDLVCGEGDSLRQLLQGDPVPIVLANISSISSLSLMSLTRTRI